MGFLQEQVSEINGIQLHTVSSNAFKTNSLILRLKAPLSEKDVTIRALLPHVLQRGTASYPSTTELRKYLDDLYGATLQVDLAKKGENHIITFRMEIPNEKFLKDKTPLLEKGIELLSEVLLSPPLQEGVFNQSIIEQEKRTLKQRIQAIYDDKMRYANLRLIQEMCKTEPYRLHVNGEKEHIDQISPQQLTDYYTNMLQHDEVDLFVIGDIENEQVADIVRKYFRLTKSNQQARAESVEKKIEKVNEVIEEQDITQGKLNIGYRTHTTYSDHDYYALQVFNGIFGGFPHSKLFLNVREKNSLAYYASSRVESHKGLLMVMSGIEMKNYERALTIIHEQMEAMKKGDFTDKELEQTKAVIKNQLLETIDTPYGMTEVLYHNVVAKTNRTIEEWIEGVEKVQKDEIVQLAEKIQLDTVYFLKGGGSL
ncbi:pitrilysin family protein [Aeribacillus composti]|uniref:EF-P 5-aminopentanol modification-associated protein YfmF n=1 Tax=Aeribacillus composti TaxID=1868734 RepID=UPI002E1AB232|nr:pitrilysin family protein [Aeribacillus composti]MED0746941.1 pitrilysin family protein [Aeribacillus composti]